MGLRGQHSNSQQDRIKIPSIRAGIRQDYLMLLIMLVAFSMPLTIFSMIEFLFKDSYHQPTMSEYVYTPAGKAFMIHAYILGLALIMFTGFKNDQPLINESVVTTMAGIGAIMTAIFPVNTCANGGLSYFNAYGNLAFGYIHLMGAAIMTIGIALHVTFCMALNPKTKGAYVWIYLACGGALLGSNLYLVGDQARHSFGTTIRCDQMNQLGYVFFIELIMVIATGVAWTTRYFERRNWS